MMIAERGTEQTRSVLYRKKPETKSEGGGWE